MKLDKLYDWLIENHSIPATDLWKELANSYFFNSQLSMNRNSTKVKSIVKLASDSGLEIPTRRYENALKLVSTLSTPLEVENIDKFTKILVNEQITN